MTKSDDLEWEFEYSVDDSPETPGVGPVLRRVVATGPWYPTGTHAQASSKGSHD